ncbi:MAG: SapC family protein [Massilia sp.]
MTKQQLIYETVVPVSHGRHAKCSIEAVPGYAVARHINSVPVMAIEFPQVAAEYTIVFAENGEDVVPVAILGVRNQENLFLDSEDNWLANYVPAFIRRYPFVFSLSDDADTYTLCIDESFSGLNNEGRGDTLFSADGKPTGYIEGVLNFLQEYRIQFQNSEMLCKKLKELNLLEPMQADFTLAEGEQLQLAGFQAVNRERLKALSGETLQQLFESDELELIYFHLHSLRNFDTIKDRLKASPAAA